MIVSLLEVNLTIDAQTITALGVMVVAVFGAYGALQQRQAAQKAQEVAELVRVATMEAKATTAQAQSVAIDTNTVVKESHVIINSQRDAMLALIKKLEGENAELRGEGLEGASP